jgi:anti-sigma factor RsiW
MEPISSGDDCASIEDDLAVLAIGALTGQDRARVLGHLEGCARCTVRLEELSATADGLLDAIPEVAPPMGFAERTMAVVRADLSRSAQRTPPVQPIRPGVPLTRRLVACAAVVAALVVGAGVGDLVATSGSGPATAVQVAPIRSSVGTEGTVVLVSSGHKGRLVMTLDDAPASGTVTCSIVLTDGSRQDVGRFVLASGYGSWTAPLPVAATSVRQVSIVDDDSGAMVGTARIG